MHERTRVLGRSALKMEKKPRAIASNSIPKRMKTMILESLSRRHGEHGDGEIKGKDFRMRGGLSRSCTASRRGFGRQAALHQEKIIKNRLEVLKSDRLLEARFVSIEGRSVSPPGVKS